MYSLIAFASTLLIASSVHSSPVDHAVQSSYLPNCYTSQYICSRNVTNGMYRPVCVNFAQLCDGHKDCPNNDDESNELCSAKDKLAAIEQSHQNNQNNQQQQQPIDGIENDFSGTGFMFSVENLVIEGGSNVKMFNQNSDNLEQNSGASKQVQAAPESTDDKDNNIN